MLELRNEIRDETLIYHQGIELSWEDDLPKGWRRTSLDRVQWQKMEEPYVKEQPD